MPFLVWTTPWALAGLVAVPALVAIYWLRIRYRPQPVSTLLFWREVPELRDAGIRWHCLQLPLLFFVELLTLLVLVGAALGVHRLARETTPPIVVILDNSVSMQAGEPSARIQAERELLKLVEPRRFAAVRLLLAGMMPRWLGEPFTDPQAISPRLQNWRCEEPTADLNRALATARDWYGDRALLLVLTDTAPPGPIEHGRLQWWAFESPAGNVAIVHALRSTADGQDCLVLEVANYGGEPASTTLTLRSGQTVLQTTSLSLQPGESQTLHYSVPAKAEMIEAVLPPDGLSVDNQVWLVRSPETPVRVGIEVTDGKVRAALEKAFRATGVIVFDQTTPHILVTDNPTRRPDETTWFVQLVLEPEGQAYTGPYLLDWQHPLCEGLSLAEAIWGAGPQTLKGRPIIRVGDIPLLTESVRSGNRRHLRLRMDPQRPTSFRAPIGSSSGRTSSVGDAVSCRDPNPPWVG